MKNINLMNNSETRSIIAVNDIIVSYTDNGNDGAPYLVFIHGFPFNKSMWNLQREALNDKCHVITYDVRGHGNTGGGNESFSIELFARDLIGLMDNLKIDKTMLCGLSMGGYISLNAVTNFPGRFNALVLSDTQCSADTPEAKEKRMIQIRNIREYGVEKYGEESIKNLFSPESFLSRKNAIADVREMIINTSEQTLCNTLLALAGRDETCGKLKDINVPVLLMVGKEDIITTPATASLMHEKIKNSSLHIIDHAGHLSNMENPFKFNYELKKFVSSIN
jgi:pimeloyl-ACP methyl ester carboxylesterase